MLVKKVVAALACVLAFGLPCAAIAASPSSSTGAKPAAEKTADAKDAADAADQKAGAEKDANAVKDATDAVQGAVPSDELLAWAEGMTCEACHADQAASAEDEKCTMAIHAPLDLACVDCHADDALIDVHANAKVDAKLPTKLKKTEVVEACATCHTIDALIEATVDSKALTDSDGNVVNPHDVPTVKDHKDITCDSCHKMHSDGSAAKRAADLCVSCHHEDVYECYTCHS